MSGKRFYKMKLRRRTTSSKAVLANFRHVGDEAIGTYIQNEAPILQANHEARQAEDIRQRLTDLDMGFRFASVSKVRWLEIQKLGIDQDPIAIINYLDIVKAQEGVNYFTTNRRL